jgi:hypothetical protein
MPPNISQQPRVFMLEPHDKDVRNAEAFGRIVRIFDGKSSRPSIWDNDKFSEDAISILRQWNYNPNVDYVLAVGALVPMIMFCTAICDIWECPQVLYWDMPNRRYIVRRLGLSTYERDEREENETIRS